MFKKFIYMTALSMALASFPNASAAMECIINGCSPYNSSALMCNNISKCINVGSLNFTKNYSIAEYNPTFNKFSLAMNIISPIVSTILGDFCCRIIFRYCSKCNRIKQIKHMSEIKISNMRRRWENFLSSEWITLFTGLCAIFAIKNDLTGIFISLIPPVVFTLLIFGTYFVYAILYSSEQQCKEDISYFDEICDSNYIRSIQDISKNDIIRKRKYIVESLKQRGKLDNVIERVGLQSIVNSGVPAGIVVRNKVDVRILLDNKFTVDELRKQGVNSKFLEDSNEDNNNIDNNSKNSIVNNNSGNCKNDFCILNIKK